MQESIVIKLADRQDVPLILSFIKELADFEKIGHEVKVTKELLEKSLFDGSARTEAVIGYLNNVPVGVAVYFYNFSTFVGQYGIYLEDIYVQPSARGKKVGTAMLSYLVKKAKEEGCHRLEWCVLDWNKNALDFYEKIGAKPREGWLIYRLEKEAFSYLDNQKI